MSNEDMRNRSGNVLIQSKLVSFLYDLMRDHLTAGQVEELIRDATEVEVAYTNGWLAGYAQDVANRLVNESGLHKKVPISQIKLPPKVGTTEDPNKYHKSPIEQPAPLGLYGVFCEPVGHKNNPCWTNSPPKSYEEAVKEADFMNRSNPAWHYYAKPIR
jgi:hypothetical protein